MDDQYADVGAGVQMLKCAGAQMCKRSNVQLEKCGNVQMCIWRQRDCNGGAFWGIFGNQNDYWRIWQIENRISRTFTKYFLSKCLVLSMRTTNSADS